MIAVTESAGNPSVLRQVRIVPSTPVSAGLDSGSFAQAGRRHITAGNRINRVNSQRVKVGTFYEIAAGFNRRKTAPKPLNEGYPGTPLPLTELTNNGNAEL